jgi:cell division protein FtsW (lipid II flippase)
MVLMQLVFYMVAGARLDPAEANAYWMNARFQMAETAKDTNVLVRFAIAGAIATVLATRMVDSTWRRHFQSLVVFLLLLPLYDAVRISLFGGSVIAAKSWLAFLLLAIVISSLATVSLSRVCAKFVERWIA